MYYTIIISCVSKAISYNEDKLNVRIIGYIG